MVIEKKKVLIIDDQVDNFEIMEAFLSIDNYQLYYASGGIKAFSLLETLEPDVILLDIMMPEMDGIEVCQRLKSNDTYKSIPVIMVTALNSKEDLAHALDQGASDFVTKPINSLELRSRVRAHLRTKSEHDELKKLLKLREEALTLREDLSNMIIHDLRNPLATIVLAAGIVQRYIDRLDQRPLILKKMAQILDSGHKLEDMFDGLLLMAKLESGKILFNAIPTDLYELGVEALKDFELVANSREIQLIGDLPDPNQTVLTDATILRRVIDNLLSNALKFSPEGSQVTLSLEYLSENHFRVQVIDRGKGVSKAEKEKIFEKFEIGSLKKNTSQIGLGLAFCKIAIEAQGGTLAIADNHPQGSIFMVEV
jgi:two-component system sensor histidine kinase/response regulator